MTQFYLRVIHAMSILSTGTFTLHAVLLLALAITSSNWTVAMRVGQVASYELPTVPCGDSVYELYGAGAKFIINGTTAVTVPEIAPGVYDESNRLAFFLKNLTEQLRTNNPERSCYASNPMINSLDLNDCTCHLSRITTQDTAPIPAWKDEGVLLNFTSCRGHRDLNVLYSLTIPQVQHTDFFSNLRAGSIVDNFTYVHPYVTLV